LIDVAQEQETIAENLFLKENIVISEVLFGL